MERKSVQFRAIVMLVALFLGFIGVPVGQVPQLAQNYSRDANAAGVVPAPLSSGPNVDGNFYINGYNPKQDDEYHNMQIISDGTKTTYETMWYKNPVDINKPFQTKFYVYMSGNADGLTFTLQGQGPTAIGQNGGSLGVYGTVRSSSYSGYISNALSVEFDPYPNADYSDSEVVKQLGRVGHVAYVHPDEFGSGGTIGGHKYIKHYSPMKANVNDAKWHSVVITWTPSVTTGEGTMNTTFDDANVGDHSVKLSQFGNGNVYWGFSGSTGAETMIGAVAYTEVIQQPALKKLVRNVTAGETAFKDTTIAKVGDTLEYQFVVENSKLNGLGNTWENVEVNDDLPDGLTTLDGQKHIELSIGDVPVDSQVTKTIQTKVTVNDDVTLRNTALATGSNYYVSPTSLLSNDATVTIQKQENAVKLTVKNQLFNLTYPDDHNDVNTTINGVLPGDQVRYVTDIKNTAYESVMTNGEYRFEVPANTVFNQVKLDDKTLTAGIDYMVTHQGNTDAVIIKNVNFFGQENLEFTADVTIGDAGGKQLSVSTLPVVTGNNPDGTKYTTDGTSMMIKYTDNMLKFTPKNIDYGARLFVNKDQVFDRIDAMNTPNTVVDVKDTRRDKSPLKVFVSQDALFKMTDNINAVLPSKLRYYENGNFTTLDNEGVQIGQTNSGQALAAISWQKDDGLRLYANGNNFIPGSYQTTLTWTVVNGY
jgi:conserved repeat domain